MTLPIKTGWHLRCGDAKLPVVLGERTAGTAPSMRRRKAPRRGGRRENNYPEYPWHADDPWDPRRWERRKDKDGKVYRYAELYWYYADKYTKRDIDDYWNQLPVARPTSGWSPPGCGSPE